MDRMIEQHFRQEAEGDVEGTLAPPHGRRRPRRGGGPGRSPARTARRGAALRTPVQQCQGKDTEVLHRLYGENFVVDDKIWTAWVVCDFLRIPGRGRRIRMRVLHVFEFRDGLVSQENVWLDGGAAVAQLTADNSTATWSEPRQSSRRVGAED
jgi:hypothetical protein